MENLFLRVIKGRKNFFVLTILPVIIFLTLNNKCLSQEGDYYPDRLYFKIWDTSSVTLPEYDSNYQGTYPYFNQLITNYGVTEIKRPFSYISNLKLSQIYELYFTYTSSIANLITELETYLFC